MGFRQPITSATAVDTGAGVVPGVKVYSDQGNPGSGVVEWDAYAATAKATLTSSQTGSGGTFFALRLAGGPALQLNNEEIPAGGGYVAAARITGAPLTVDGLAGLAAARMIATGRAPLSGTNAANSWQPVPFGAAPLDSHNGFQGSGGTRWTVPAGQAGVYALAGQVVFTSDAGNPQHNARITVNGATFPGCAGNNGTLGTADGVASLTGLKVVQLGAGDQVQLQGYSANAWATTTYPDNVSNLQVIRVR